MNIAVISQFQGYIVTAIVSFLVLYIVIPLALSALQAPNGRNFLDADASVVWNRLRLVAFVLILIYCGYGASRRYVADRILNQDTPSGRQEAQNLIDSYNRRFGK